MRFGSRRNQESCRYQRRTPWRQAVRSGRASPGSRWVLDPSGDGMPTRCSGIERMSRRSDCDTNHSWRSGERIPER